MSALLLTNSSTTWKENIYNQIKTIENSKKKKKKKETTEIYGLKNKKEKMKFIRRSSVTITILWLGAHLRVLFVCSQLETASLF